MKSFPQKNIPASICFGLFVSFITMSCGNSNNQTNVDSTAIKTYNAHPDVAIGLAEIQPEGLSFQILPQVSGVIHQIDTKMNDNVAKGKILFVIDHSSQDAVIKTIKAQIDEQIAAINSAKANLNKAIIAADIAQKNYVRIKEVFGKGADTKSDLDVAESTKNSALADVDNATANINSANARLSELKANLDAAQIELKKYFIQSLTSGKTVSVTVALGQMVGPTTPLGEFVPNTPIDAVTEIDELFADKVRLNQLAYIRKQGAFDTLALGYVVQIAPSLQQKSLFSDEVGKLEDRRVRELKIRLTKGHENVIYGQRVECVINIKK